MSKRFESIFFLMVAIAIATYATAAETKTPPTDDATKPAAQAPAKDAKSAAPAPNVNETIGTFVVEEVEDDGDTVTAIPYDPEGKLPMNVISMSWPNTGLKKGQVFTVILRPELDREKGGAKMVDVKRMLEDAEEASLERDVDLGFDIANGIAQKITGKKTDPAKKAEARELFRQGVQAIDKAIK